MSRSQSPPSRRVATGLNRRRVGSAAFSAFLCLCATTADAQDATWLSAPGSSDWDTATNWTNETVPTGTATFGASNTTTLTFSSGTFIGTIQLNAGAPGYTFDVGPNFLEVDGTGIVNNSSNRLTLSNSGPEGTFFVNASTAGDTIIRNTSTGFTEFAGTSTAGTAFITNSTGATTFFVETSTAGAATITTNSGSFTEFNDASTAGDATVITNSGGTTLFQNTGSGGQAQFIINAGGRFDISLLSSTGTTAGSIAGGGDYFLGSKALTVGSNNISTEVSGIIADGGLGGGAGGSLVKVGGGTLTLTGANTYTGGTTISAGTLQIGAGGTTGSIVGNVADNSALAFDRSDNVTFDGVISGTGSLTQLGGGTLTLTGANTYTGGTTISAGTLQIGAAGTTGSIVGNVADNSALAFDRSDNVTFDGVISGTGSLTQLGGGTLTLTGANTYTGGTTISAGTLQIGAAGTTGSIVGNVADNSALAFDRSDNVTFDGVISGTGSLTQLGGGTLTLTGANTYTGGTTISAGTLQIGAAGTTGSIVGNVADNSALAFDRSDNVTFDGVISGTGSLTQLGGGTLTLTGANTYTGGTTISAGTLQIGAAGTTGSIVGNVADNSALAFDRSDNVTFDGVISGTGSLTQLGGGTLTLTGANTYTGGTTISAGTLQIGAGGTTGSIVGNVADNSALAFDRSDNVTFDGVISGTGSLTQLGGGTLTLTGANTYTGGTTISAGTLQIGAGGTTGSIVGNVADNSALAFDRSDNVTFDGVISGTGSLIQLGGGTLTLTGANTYAGGTTISAGTLQIGAGGTTGSIVGNVADNSALAFDRSDNVTFDGVISGTGSLTQLGGGTLTLTGANTYTGGTTISAGTLLGGATNTFSAASPTTIEAGGTLDLGGFAQTINAVDLAGGAITHGQLTGAIASSGGTINGLSGSPSLTTNAGTTMLLGTNALGTVTNGSTADLIVATGTTTLSGLLKNSGFLTVAAGATLNASGGVADVLGGSITAPGTLTVTTTNASAVAVGLQGNGASVLATGGGSIVSAGTAVAFLGGTNQVATFDNFKINNQTGDLSFADSSVATINLASTVANAGTNNLLDATAGSVVTLNASASRLTGAIQTDSTSTTNVNLANATTWTMTGSSTVTNLSVANSMIVFAPPGSGAGFKTLTVTNYVGSGANITLNTALGGSNSASDQIIINGGSATGKTSLTIKNIGGGGGQTTGAGIPIVVATNGGKTSSDAFSLANTPIVGGFRYTLDQSNQDWFLVSSPTSTVADITNSVTNIAKAQQSQIITNRVLTSILLGATQQINCSDCGSAFGSFGSLALGAQGRWGLSDELTFIGGASYNQWTSQGVSVDDAPTVAGALIYDFVNWGRSRPFFEVGGGLTPYEHVNYTRTYANGLSRATGNGSALDRDLSVFARVGWVSRVTPIDEAAVYADVGRIWMQTGGYSEPMTAVNPYPATVNSGLDTLNIARIGGQYTHLFFGNIEANVSGGIAYGFSAGSGSAFDVTDFGPISANALPNTTWVEYGARIGYRFNDRMVVDAFVLGTGGGEVGTTVHGGIALRYAF